MSHSPGLMDSLKRMLRTLLYIAQSRLELLGYEIEEERLRLGMMLLLGSLALFFLGLGILLCTTLIVVYCWDTHRELVLASLSTLFFIAGIFFAYHLRHLARARPRLFTCSLAELANDLEQLDARP